MEYVTASFMHGQDIYLVLQASNRELLKLNVKSQLKAECDRVVSTSIDEPDWRSCIGLQGVIGGEELVPAPHLQGALKTSQMPKQCACSAAVLLSESHDDTIFSARLFSS